jgi:cobalt-zinc-cadmium efflux system protein
MPNEGPAHNIVPQNDEKKLFFVLCLTACIMLLEIAGGYISGSLALLADAGHMFTDVAALFLSWLAMRLGRRRPDARRTFGYQRLKILAAYTNGVLLFFLCGIIVVEALNRLINPPVIAGGTMLWVAVVGFATNLISYFILRPKNRADTHDHTHQHPHHHHQHHDLNIRSALLHVLSDLFGSAGAITAAIIILTTGWTEADAISSIFVSVLILVYAITLTKQTVHILIEGAPDDSMPKQIREMILKEIKGVKDVHHIHVWSLTEKQPIATLDVTIEEDADDQKILCDIQALLNDHFRLDHVTVQIEKGPCIRI